MTKYHIILILFENVINNTKSVLCNILNNYYCICFGKGIKIIPYIIVRHKNR